MLNALIWPVLGEEGLPDLYNADFAVHHIVSRLVCFLMCETKNCLATKAANENKSVYQGRGHAVRNAMRCGDKNNDNDGRVTDSF